PRVEYSLTEIGNSLRPILDAMHKWGTKYRMLNGKKAEGKKHKDLACESKAEVA
ncbi:MAG TPA: winged helix-turn-helix transcriptional regulator, partial [Nitrospirota bacterium]|nr:winged helix-turn-helix transcriptional regulator [Nitrospirota bacterium]